MSMDFALIVVNLNNFVTHLDDLHIDTCLYVKRKTAVKTTHDGLNSFENIILSF